MSSGNRSGSSWAASFLPGPAAGVLDKADPWDNQVSFGLGRILDGVDVLIRRVGRQD